MRGGTEVLAEASLKNSHSLLYISELMERGRKKEVIPHIHVAHYARISTKTKTNQSKSKLFVMGDM